MPRIVKRLSPTLVAIVVVLGAAVAGTFAGLAVNALVHVFMLVYLCYTL